MGSKDDWGDKDNIYYHPEKYDLEVVHELELAGKFDFDTHVVYKHKDGHHFYTYDSGCSCPTPFENVKFSDLQKITERNFFDFTKTIMQIDARFEDKFDMIQKVAKSLHVSA